MVRFNFRHSCLILLIQWFGQNVLLRVWRHVRGIFWYHSSYARASNDENNASKSIPFTSVDYHNIIYTYLSFLSFIFSILFLFEKAFLFILTSFSSNFIRWWKMWKDLYQIIDHTRCNTCRWCRTYAWVKVAKSEKGTLRRRLLELSGKTRINLSYRRRIKQALAKYWGIQWR